MIKQIASIARRSGDTLLQDMAGGAALMTMLVVGLHLPVLL